ncbi:NUMOD4 domain-containing protein [Candidatus Williamhamiltonella defendens]
MAGFEERYEVSHKGQVRSISRTVPLVSNAGRKYYRNIPGKILSP